MIHFEKGVFLLNNRRLAISFSLILFFLIPAAAIPDTSSLQLYPGWNFISIPGNLAPGSDTFTIFNSIDTGGHSIWEYKAESQKWVRKYPNDRLSPLVGYWIFSKFQISVLIVQSENHSGMYQRDFLEGWNTVGLSGNSLLDAHSALLPINNEWTQVMGYDVQNQQYEVQIINGGSNQFSDSRQLLPMKGYWVYMKNPGQLSIPATIPTTSPSDSPTVSIPPTQTPPPIQTVTSTVTPTPSSIVTETTQRTSPTPTVTTSVPTGTQTPIPLITATPTSGPTPEIPTYGNLIISDLNLQEEYVRIYNAGTWSVSLANWTLHDEGSNFVYTFPNVIIAPETTITIHSHAKGQDTGTDLYWTDRYVWNNEGGTAYLVDSQGNLVNYIHKPC